MSEYIVELPESGAADEAVKRFGADGSRLYGYRLTGEIVRCRDCKFYHPREGATLNCRFEHPSIPNLVEWCIAEPYGFCAWGERKEGV